MPDIFVSPPTTATNPDFFRIRSNQKQKNSKNKFDIYKQFFSSYLFMPEGVRFETQEPGESIILLLRKHWITNVIWIFISLLLLILPIIVFPLVALSGIIPTHFSGSFLSVVILVWYLLAFSYILVNFLLWYFTVSIVTNERIIDIDFINILNKRFSATRISKVEDVTMKRGGFIRAIFDFGDIFVQTAGTEVEFEFLAVPKPEQIVRIINELMGKKE